VALRQAAVRLGTKTLSRSDYQRAREEIVALTQDPAARRKVERAMPTLTSIETVLAQNAMDWEDGVTMVGLNAHEARSVAGMSIDAAVRAFLAEIGKLPRSANQLRNWTRERSVSLAQASAAEFKSALANIQQHTDGTVPVAKPRDHRRSEAQAPAAVAGPPARSAEWRKPQVIAGLAKAIRILGPGAQLTQRSLKEIARSHPGQGIPSWSPVHRCLTKQHPGETWDEWRRQAEQLAGGPATA
jgi:hypothetical protein